jgi:hypothetical protein
MQPLKLRKRLQWLTKYAPHQAFSGLLAKPFEVW